MEEERQVLAFAGRGYGTRIVADDDRTLDLPSPLLYQAIEAADKKQEDKVFSGLERLREEDPSFTIERNAETKQTLIGGQGEQQLSVVMAKLKDRFGVEVAVIPQKIVMRPGAAVLPPVSRLTEFTERIAVAVAIEDRKASCRERV